jgi:minor extracellular serine protease Vpr
MRRPLIVWFATLLASAALAAESRYALILEDPPIAKTVHSRKALRTQAALDARARIEAAQRKVQQQLAQRHIRVTGSVETLLNAVFVATDNPSQLQDIPGVRRVALLRQFRRHLNAALPLVQTQQAWSALASAGYPNAGAGVKIAILDTGIDQNHAAFQDPSLPTPANLPACNDFPGLAGNNDCAYTNSKVIAARSYVRMLTPLTATISRPDDESSRDRVGHGTAAAMAAAGVQNTGPLATITGMAPKAYLGNYKIFGSPGVNDTTSGDALSLALEDAVNDHMDIASLSVGFPAWYAPEDTGAACGEPAGVSCEVEAQAVEAAIGLGMAVVVSAGNDGASGLNYPALNSIHTPGTAPSAVTVGASVNGHVIYGHAGLTAADAGSLGNMDASFGDGWNARVTAPLRDVSRLGNDGLACTALASNSLGGAVALVQRGTCDFWTKAVNTRNAGAVGVLIYREANEDTPFRPLGLRGTGIPTAIIGYTNGQGLKNYLLTHPDASVTLDASTLSAYTDPEQDMAAVTSSRGPAIGDFHIKPELVAPGTSIYTATQRYDPNGDLYDPSGYAIADGTSFAAPIVAGAIAMVKQKNPGFTVAQLKSAVVNTASTGIQDEGPARVTAVGAGKLDAEAAVKTNVTCDPATVSFGVVTPAMIGASRALTIYNGSSSPVTLAVVPTTTDPSAHLELSSTTIAAGQQDTIAVYLRGTVPAPGEYEGAITITGGAVPLRVPYLYMVGDGVPANAFPIQNTDFVDLADRSPSR